MKMKRNKGLTCNVDIYLNYVSLMSSKSLNESQIYNPSLDPVQKTMKKYIYKKKKSRNRKNKEKRREKEKKKEKKK